jgi:chaperonin GroES
VRLEPLGPNVLILPHAAGGVSRGGLLIPAIAKSNTPFLYGDVIAVGPGATNAQGITKPVGVKVGDTVMFAKNAGNEFPLEDEHGERIVKLMAEQFIIGIVHDLPRKSAITGLDGRLLEMTPFSRARPDVGYENMEKLELARRAGFVDINPDGTDDYVDETEGLP